MPRNKLPKPGKRSFAERFFPARPRRLLSIARTIANTPIPPPKNLGLANASNAAYVRWLKKESMLANAEIQAKKYSGQGQMWQNPFARPQPRRAVNIASVWYTAYPISMITEQGQSTLQALGDKDLWRAFASIGIKAVHTGPMKRAGGIRGWKTTPSIDGHFDRISTRIDPLFGTEEQYKQMCEVANNNGGIIIDDIVPGHTGKGPDFRLAEMNYQEYPGIYHMVEIDKKDWQLLPEVPAGKDSINIDEYTERELKSAGYIIGRLPRVIFYEPGVKETNWSVTKPVKGVDGKQRRWVYLHYFKAGQPSLNWLDPSFAGMKLVVGDALHSIGDLGSKALRLDANGFLGIETSSDDTPAWSEGHPLSEAANHLIASMVRKFGGFTFQELNLSIDDIKIMSEDGADLSYDFINRPAYHHAVATGDTEFLRLMLRLARDQGVDPASLVHALQNHDELTYELVHFWTIHKDDDFEYHGKTLKGSKLRELVRKDLHKALTSTKQAYNLPFAENGIACTNTSSIAAILGYQDITSLTHEDIQKIQKVHLLLAMFNALQPGVFALSGWDLSGSLTLDKGQVGDLISDGDTRWINRGAYDLLGKNPTADASASGMPKSVNLYGTLTDQLKTPDSFACNLQRILKVREEWGIATAKQLDIPDVNNKSLLVLIHELPEHQALQVTVLNFGKEPVDSLVTSEFLPPKATVVDMFTDEVVGTIDKTHSLMVHLKPHQGTSLLLTL